MTAPRTLPDLYRHLGVPADLTHIECLTTAKLKEMLRQTWHFAIAAAEAERQGIPMPEETGVKPRPRKGQR